jgi:putative redox protein
MVHPTSVNVKWVDGYTFLATNGRGYSILMDAPVEEGDVPLSISPAQTLLAALGGCTGIDVVSILKKMRQKVTGLRIEVTGDRTPGYPKYFKEIHVKYVVEGMGIDRVAIEKAIALSEEKYCTVSNTVNGKAKVDWSYEIVESR